MRVYESFEEVCQRIAKQKYGLNLTIKQIERMNANSIPEFEKFCKNLQEWGKK